MARQKTYLYYEGGMKETLTESQLLHYFNTDENMKEQIADGITFDSWIYDLLRMQILIPITL